MPDPANLSTPLAYALAYAAIGWHVLPLEVNTKHPLGRLVPRGMHDATVDQQTIRSWWQRAPGAGIGIALAQSGLVAIDVDPRNGGADTFEHLQAAHGSLRSDVMAFTGGGGEHHVFLLPHGAAISLPGTLGPGVDLKANGYIVVEPSIHPSGKAYGWESSSSPLDGVVPSPLPDWLRSLRVELQSPQARPDDVPVDARQARDAREALYLLDVDSREDWLHSGMALHATGWGHPAYAMWCSWSQGSPKFDATDCRRVWESFSADSERGAMGLTLAWIFAEAQKRGWKNPAAKVEQEPAGSPAVTPDSLVLTIDQLYARASSVRWAVKGIVPEQGLGFVFGASQAFKSFLTLDYALHRLYGMRWLGRKTKQATPVYLAAEGGAGLMRRIQAWHQARKMDWRACGMRVVVVPLTLRTQAKTLRAAIQAAGVEPGDVVIDTMSQTFTGDENSNDQVADFLRVLGTELRDSLSCTVTVVHHTGHSASERPRGASAIISNVDYALGVFREEKQMLCTVEFAKVKDSERPDPASFELSVQHLGRDEDGDAITSLAARHLNSADELIGAMQANASAGMTGRNGLLLNLVQNGMPEKELRKAFYDASDITDIEARKKAFYRARDFAVSNGFIEVAQGVVIVLKGTK